MYFISFSLKVLNQLGTQEQYAIPGFRDRILSGPSDMISKAFNIY